MMVEITEIRIKLMEGSEDRLRAFCSITIDQSFVVRDLKIIDGTNGPFVAMPSRKLTGHCHRCGGKNHLRAGYCNQCGNKQNPSHTADVPQKLYADVAHPINSECREMIQNAVITEFQAELDRAAQPGYRSRYEDDFDAGDYDAGDYADTSTSTSAAKPKDSAIASNANTTATPARQTPSLPTPTPAPSPQRDVAAESKPDPSEHSFGAGLFDTEPNESDSITRQDNPDDRLVRAERGKAGNSVPRPHFNNPSREHQPAVVKSGDAEAVQNASQSSDDHDDADDSGFGAGILDD